MSARSELTTHSLRDSFHCIFMSKLMFPLPEFKSLSSVHAQINTYWEKKGPHGLWDTADAVRAASPRSPGGRRSLAARGGEEAKGSWTKPCSHWAVHGRGRRLQILAAGAGVTLALSQPPLRRSNCSWLCVRRCQYLLLVTKFTLLMVPLHIVWSFISMFPCCIHWYIQHGIKSEPEAIKMIYTNSSFFFLVSQPHPTPHPHPSCCGSLEPQISCDSSQFFISVLKALGWYL